MDPKQVSNSIKSIINNKSYGIQNSPGTNALLKACVSTLNSLIKKNVSIQPVNNKKNNVSIKKKVFVCIMFVCLHRTYID